MAEVPASPIPPGDSRRCDEPRRPGPGSAAANGNQSVKALVYVAAFAPEKAVMLLRIGPRQVYLSKADPPGKAYPVDSGGATCCALNDRIRPVAGTTIDGQRAFAFAISESVF